MGPLGPMMGGWRGWGPAAGGPPAGSWSVGGPDLALVLVLVLLLALAVIAFVAWRSSAPGASREPRSAAEVLRERYARGELTQEQYREMLIDILKDRYVRGEMELDAYEAQLELLLAEERSRSRAGRLPAAEPSVSTPVSAPQEEGLRER